jgi:adenosylcobinamide-GDP ribazoletransferase
MPLAGRCSLMLMMAFLPYVRLEGGLGTLFYTRNLQWATIISMIILFTVSFVVLGITGLVAAGLVSITVLLFSWFCHLKIGGATGDTLGAVCEISETVLVIFLSAGQLE